MRTLNRFIVNQTLASIVIVVVFLVLVIIVAFVGLVLLSLMILDASLGERQPSEGVPLAHWVYLWPAL